MERFFNLAFLKATSNKLLKLKAELMKPLKSGLSFANWLIRLAFILFVVFNFKFLSEIKTFNFSGKEFYLASAFVLFGALLFIGGFMSKPALTVISGFIISGLAIYKIVILFSGAFENLVSFIIILAIGFYFACAGNS